MCDADQLAAPKGPDRACVIAGLKLPPHQWTKTGMGRPSEATNGIRPSLICGNEWDCTSYKLKKAQSDLLAIQTFLRFRPSCDSDLLAIQTFLRFRPSCDSDLLAIQTFLRFRPSCDSDLLAIQTFLRFRPSCDSDLLAIQTLRFRPSCNSDLLAIQTLRFRPSCNSDLLAIQTFYNNCATHWCEGAKGSNFSSGDIWWMWRTKQASIWQNGC